MLEAINLKDHHKVGAQIVDTLPVGAEKVAGLQAEEGATTSITMF